MKRLPPMFLPWFPYGGLLMVSFAAVAGGAEGVPGGFEEYERGAAAGAAPSAKLSAPLQALWYARGGKWEKAHDLAQDMDTPVGSWIHALLHREEGDEANAAYWYRRAGRVMPEGYEVAEEWSFLARELWRAEHGIRPGLEVVTSPQGLVAGAEAAEPAEEGVWSTRIRDRKGKTLLVVTNARPVAFSPTGEYLLLREAAADDDCRHFLIRAAAGGKVPPLGARQRLGGRQVAGYEWREEGRKLVLLGEKGEAQEAPAEEVFEVVRSLTETVGEGSGL